MFLHKRQVAEKVANHQEGTRPDNPANNIIRDKVTIAHLPDPSNKRAKVRMMGMKRARKMVISHACHKTVWCVQDILLINRVSRMKHLCDR